jgi:hypothetical protein
LVPPAPSAFSNSVLLIEPSPLPSSSENRSFNAVDWLVEADVADVPEDWPWASSIALMVVGDKQPLDDEEPLEEDVAVELPGVTELVRSKAFCVRPVVAALDEDFDVVSDCKSPSADEAAAISMTKLPDTPQHRGPYSRHQVQQAVCQRKNIDKTKALIAAMASISRQMMPPRQNLPPPIRPHCPCA